MSGKNNVKPPHFSKRQPIQVACIAATKLITILWAYREHRKSGVC